MTDKRCVYGATCSWWGSIHEVVVIDGLPRCPKCHGTLWEMESEDDFLASAKRYEERGNPGYLAMVQWARGKCFPSYDEAQLAYKLQHDPA